MHPVEPDEYVTLEARRDPLTLLLVAMGVVEIVMLAVILHLLGAF